jgi:hypothetical protein
MAWFKKYGQNNFFQNHLKAQIFFNFHINRNQDLLNRAMKLTKFSIDWF